MMLKGYSVRKAEQGDLAAVMQVERQSFEENIVEYESVFADRIAYAVDCNYVLVKTNTQSVCGYFTAELWDFSQIGADAFALGHSVRERHQSTGTALYISSFALLPDVRGQSIAEKFFAASIERIAAVFPQLERIILLVHEDWHKAIRIYEKQGFIRTQVLDRFAWFGDKQAFIYEKMIGALKNAIS